MASEQVNCCREARLLSEEDVYEILKVGILWGCEENKHLQLRLASEATFI